jgi:polyisoprenoid-binding protein YceI
MNIKTIPFLKKYLSRKSGLLFCFLMVIHYSFGQFHPVAKESSVQFTIHNFGFRVTGSLGAPQGDIRFNPDSLSNCFFRVTIKSESINTDNSMRDEHLKEEDYFDVKKYPLISFVSGNFQKAGKNQFVVSGRLTIKKETRDIQIPFTVDKSGNGYLFTGTFKMNRRDYEVGGGSTISNELTVEIKVVAR